MRCTVPNRDSKNELPSANQAADSKELLLQAPLDLGACCFLLVRPGSFLFLNEIKYFFHTLIFLLFHICLFLFLFILTICLLKISLKFPFTMRIIQNSKQIIMLKTLDYEKTSYAWLCICRPPVHMWLWFVFLDHIANWIINKCSCKLKVLTWLKFIFLVVKLIVF